MYQTKNLKQYASLLDRPSVRSLVGYNTEITELTNFQNKECPIDALLVYENYPLTCCLSCSPPTTAIGPLLEVVLFYPMVVACKGRPRSLMYDKVLSDRTSKYRLFLLPESLSQFCSTVLGSSLEKIKDFIETLDKVT